MKLKKKGKVKHPNIYIYIWICVCVCMCVCDGMDYFLVTSRSGILGVRIQFTEYNSCLFKCFLGRGKFFGWQINANRCKEWAAWPQVLHCPAKVWIWASVKLWQFIDWPSLEIQFTENTVQSIQYYRVTRLTTREKFAPAPIVKLWQFMDGKRIHLADKIQFTGYEKYSLEHTQY